MMRIFRWIKQLGKNEDGTVVVLLAISMVVLAGFTALVTDAGLLFVNHSRISNAIDSAVLAGVQELPANPGQALEVASYYALHNGIAPGECEFVITDPYTIQGTAERQVGFFFAPLLGFNDGQVHSSARARIKPIAAISGIEPFGVLEGDYSFGQEVILKEGAGEQLYPGWFGALSLGGYGASIYEENIKQGYSGEIKIGDVIEIEAGNMSQPTRKGINYRLNSCHHVPYCQINQFVQGCPRILIVPIVNIEEMNDAGHPSSVRVVAFGAFLADSYVGSGNENRVKGSFVRYVAHGKTGEYNHDYGLYSSELCE